MVTEAKAEELLAERKVIAANMVWRFQQPSYKLEATVLAEDSGETLKLRGTVGRKNRSFVLLYGDTPIRKYTAHDRHRDRETGKPVKGPHKHLWDEVYESGRVYIPTDIRIGDANDELVDFLKECNITLRGAYMREAFSQLNQGTLL